MLHLTPRAHTSNGASGFQNIHACLQDPGGHTLQGEAPTELPGAPSPTHWGGRAPHWPLHPFLPLGRGWEPIWAPAEQLVTLSRKKKEKRDPDKSEFRAETVVRSESGRAKHLSVIYSER